MPGQQKPAQPQYSRGATLVYRKPHTTMYRHSCIMATLRLTDDYNHTQCVAINLSINTTLCCIFSLLTANLCDNARKSSNEYLQTAN